MGILGNLFRCRGAARAVLLLVALAPPVLADYAAGVAALRAHDYPRAFRELLPVARAGDPRAQERVAALYRRGYGVDRSYSEAIAWYRRAAAQGSGSAAYSLGVHYREGLGVPRDAVTASNWFRSAARAGYIPAQINLGLRYAAGRGVGKDPVRGYAWLHRAAMHGNRLAMRRRTALGKTLSPAQIKEAKALADTLAK